MKIIFHKRNELFSLKKFKETPFSLLNNLKVHKNQKLILLREVKSEWDSEYYLIYNMDSNEQS
jgi:hypothetical protein